MASRKRLPKYGTRRIKVLCIRSIEHKRGKLLSFPKGQPLSSQKNDGTHADRKPTLGSGIPLVETALLSLPR